MRPKSKDLPIEDQIDIFGEAVNETIDLRKRRAPFENERFLIGRIDEERS